MPSLIDKLFKSKLQARNYSPEANDWAAMEALINADGSGGMASSASINWMFISAISLLLCISIFADIQSVESSKTIHERSLTRKSKNSNLNSAEINAIKPTNINTGVSNSTASVKKIAFQVEGFADQPQANNELILNKEIYTTSEKSASTNKSHLSKITLKEGINNKSELWINDIDKNESLSKKASGTEVFSLNTAQTNQQAQVDPSFYKSAGKVTIENSSKNQYGGKKAARENFNVDELSHFSRASNDYYEIKKSTVFKGTSLILYSSSINNLDNQLKKQEVQSSKRDESPPFAAYDQKQRRKLPIQFSIAAFGELSYNTKKITGANEYQSLIDLRNEQEKNIIGGGVGIELQAKYKQLGFSTGFSLQNWGENVQYEEKYTYEWDVTSSTNSDTLWTQEMIITIDTLFNAIDSTFYIVVDSSFISVIDSIYTFTVYDSTQIETALGLSDQNGKTTISYWEIPLYFSYQFDIGDFYLSPGLGVTIGFLKITQGYYMAEDLNSLIEMNTNYAVFKKTLVNGQLNLGLGYKLGDKWSIEATPSYRFNLTNILENPDLTQRYSRFSLQFRIRYYF